MGGFSDFATHKHQENLCFRVANIAPSKKTLTIHQFPIPFGKERDFMQEGGFTEDDIKISLLKGEFRTKALAGEIVVTCSNINLIVFSDAEKDFLTGLGITTGLSAGSKFNMKYNIELTGVRNGRNRTFYTPEPFINGNYEGNALKITVYAAGRALLENVDYFVRRGFGQTGVMYDRIEMFSFAPEIITMMYATYAIPAQV
jgi:hypothetical protein